MIRQFLLIGMLFGASVFIRAQSITPDVIASGGDFYSSSGGSVSWTLGEPMGEIYSSTNNIVTQGFQQPWDFGTGMDGVQTPVNAAVFPNPTTDVVTLEFGATSGGVYIIEVFNGLGQQMSAVQFVASPSSQTFVSLFDYANGIYFITVRKMDGTESSTFKINKND